MRRLGPLLTAGPGILKAVQGAETVRDKENVTEFHLQFKAADRTPPLRWALDRVDHVMAERPTSGGVVAACDSALELPEGV
ncbi:hypothetical protein [Streptomyces sp. MspMP-M5]|uniref:hypothetical protein n=1 Tax=Streptomyces sp. MspMP-M5 TaxID=1155718 RepID=UPI00036B8362|nr:hypothetical protein [Streptomyces sp. SID8354]